MKINACHGYTTGKSTFFVTGMLTWVKRIWILTMGQHELHYRIGPWMVGFILFLIAQGYTTRLCSQSHILRVRGEDSSRLFSLTPLSNNYTDFSACQQALKVAKMELIKLGYLECSLDSLEVSDNETKLYVAIGQPYQWASLRNANVEDALMANAQLKPEQFFQKPVQITKLQAYFDKIIVQLENNGYPFAYLYLDSIENNLGQIKAAIHLEKGPLVKLDSVLLNEESPITKSFMLHYLGLKEGMLYNEQKIKSMSMRIRELPYLQENAPWRIQFNISKTKLNFDLKSRNANRADILIGLLPSNDELQGKFLLTGDIKLAFVNALSQGESIQLNWQNLQYKSPRYNIKAQYPYLFNTPLGISFAFDFYKKDTSFKNLNGELGLIYQLNANDQVKIYYELASTRVGSVNIATLKATRQLPNIADVTYKTIGAEGIFQQLDYKLNPRKGYRLFVNAGLSFRSFIRNTIVEETYDVVSNRYFSYLYDSIPKQSYKYQIKGGFQYYTPLTKRVVLASLYQGGYALSNQALFRNELYQIGGYRLLRGFDEGSMFVNNYHVITIEPRYLLSLNSYFFLFGDVSRINTSYYQYRYIDFPYSTGIGMTLDTKAGQFNLSYAVGARKDQPLQLRNSKIHFGYLSLF